MCRRVVSSWPLSIAAGCLLTALCVSLCGCGEELGGKPKAGWNDEQIIAQGVVGSLNPSSAEEFALLFVEGKAPESERERFLKYSSFHAEPGDVVLDDSGTSATVTVQLRDSGRKPVGDKVEWKVVKKDGDWKLESAPLPAAAK